MYPRAFWPLNTRSQLASIDIRALEPNASKHPTRTSACWTLALPLNVPTTLTFSTVSPALRSLFSVASLNASYGTPTKCTYLPGRVFCSTIIGRIKLSDLPNPVAACSVSMGRDDVRTIVVNAIWSGDVNWKSGAL